MGSLRQQQFAWMRVIVCLLLAGAVFAVYWPALHYDFVNFDDLGYVIQNRHVQHGFNPDDLRWAFTSFYAGNWHPITWLSLMLDWQFFHLNSGGYHLTNVLLHAANTTLLFLMLLAAMQRIETPNSKLQTSGEPQDPNTKHEAPEKLQKFNAENAKGAETRRVQHQTEEPTAKYAKYAKPEDRISGTQPPDSVVAMPQSAMTSATQNPESRIRNRPSRLSTLSLQPSFWLAAFVAALFGLHPMHVESVAWIAERKDVLSTFFFLLTIWAYVRYARKYEDLNAESAKTAEERKGNPIAQGSKFFYGLALVLFALGLMSKPMLVTTPFILLLLDFWPLGPLRLSTLNSLSRQSDTEAGSPHRSSKEADSSRRSNTKADPLSTVLDKLPFFALSAADCVLTYMAQSHTGAVASAEAAPIDTRLCNSILSYGAYIVKFFLPGNMAVYYPLRQNPPLWSVAVTAAILIAITILVILWRERRPYLAFGWFWFVGTLVPVIGLVQVGLQGMADRYTYIPYIGLSIGVIWLIADLFGIVKSFSASASSSSSASSSWSWRFTLTTHPAVLAALSIIALTACALGASHQVRYWQTSETLWRQAVRVAPGNAIARQNLGSALTEQRRFAEAAQEFEEALKIAPMYAEAESNFGFVLFMLGRNDEAVAHYKRALEMKPIGRTHYLLAKVLMAEGKTADAITEYKRAVELEPELPPALNDLAWILASDPDPSLRNGPDAVRMAEQACATSLTPNPLMIGTLAAAYAEAGRFPDAIATAERAKALALQQGNTIIAEKNEELLKLYRAGKPYHEPAGPVK